jgi:superfamily II DNA or RNA helicase
MKPTLGQHCMSNQCVFHQVLFQEKSSSDKRKKRSRLKQKRFDFFFMISFPLSELSQDEFSTLKSRLTCKVEEFKTKEIRDLCFFHEVNESIYVPRHILSRERLMSEIFPSSKCPKMKSKCLFTSSLRPAQIEALHNIGKCLDSTFGGILIAPPGIGKTRIAIALACALGLRCTVLCFQQDLMDQTKQQIAQCVPNAKIGWIQSNVCEYQDCDFILASVWSIAERSNYPEDALTCGVLIVDEVHHVACKTYIQAFCKMRPRFVLGLTATPRPNKELNEMVEYMIGPVCFRMQRPPNSQVQVNMISYSLGAQQEIRYANRSKNWSYMITLLTKDNIRNRLLIDLIKLIYKAFPKRKGLLLSARVDHLKQLYRELDPSICVVITNDVHTDLNKQERAAKKRKHENLPFEKFLTLSTYPKMGEGTDFDGDFVILATPQPKAEQSTGRITRERDLEHRPVIFDIVDPFSCFDEWRWLRYRYYESNSYEILMLRERDIFAQGLKLNN